jgi:hypothetical protein
MKRLCWFFLVAGVVFLLWILHRPVSPYFHRAAENQSVLSQKQFIFRWCRALRAASPVFPRTRAGPLESFATHSASLITDDVGSPWLDYRWPPGSNACRQGLVAKSCKAGGEGGDLKGSAEHFPTKFRTSEGQIQTRGFATRFS